MVKVRRKFSMKAYWDRITEEWEPFLKFKGKTNEDGDLIRERVVFNSEEFMSVPCQVLRPKKMKSNRSNAAIICTA